MGNFLKGKPNKKTINIPKDVLRIIRKQPLFKLYNIKKRGKVLVGRKARRGVTGDRSTKVDNYINIDVTSGSRKKFNGKEIKYDLSPLLIGSVTDKHGLQSKFFENYWQYSKWN